MWYVYFIRLSNGDVYVGSTNDLRRRQESHRRGQAAATRAHLPFALISYVAVGSAVVARNLEKYFKSGSGKALAAKRLW